MFFFYIISSCLLLFRKVDALPKRSNVSVVNDQCSYPNIGNICFYIVCENDGYCLEDKTTPDCFKCQCTPGYTGKVCETMYSILPMGCSPGCLNDAVCDGNKCLCPVGFSGILCEIRDHCLPINPCLNGGKCMSTGTNYTCNCENTGYTGPNCEQIIVENPCISNPCHNGGLCLLNGEETKCLCLYGYRGINCQIPPIPCAFVPCQNGGKCKTITETKYECICPPEFTGDQCETFILNDHPCVTMPSAVCQNGGVCNVNGRDYICKCAAGWNGTNCQMRQSMSSCDPNPCGDHGMCMVASLPIGPIAVCNCDDQWTGRYCDVIMNCPPMYTGSKCESMIMAKAVPSLNHCSPNPCKNGGTCVPFRSSYFCFCGVNKYTGKNCDSLTPLSRKECPLNCSPGQCIFSGNPDKPYACLWNGIMRPTNGTIG